MDDRTVARLWRLVLGSLALLALLAAPFSASAQKIAGGGGHTLALRADGTLWAWGHNGAGQLGDGTKTNRTSPVRVPVVDGSGQPVRFMAAVAGSYHSRALAADGSLWACGSIVGDGTTTDSASPVRVPIVDGSGQPGSFTAVAAGDNHSLALAADGTLRAWGYNADGQLGDGTTYHFRVTPVGVVGPDGRGYFDASLDIFPDGAQGEAPLTVGFSSFHTPLASAVDWDFGDGHTSNEATPSHTFDTPGLYTVTFTEQVPDGGTPGTTSTQSTTVKVTVLDTASDGGGSGGGGCAFNPSVGFGLEWLLLLAPLALGRLRRSGRRVN